MSPPAFQRAAERAAEAGGSFVPSPDAALGDGDGAARHPYQSHSNSVAPDALRFRLRLNLDPDKCIAIGQLAVQFLLVAMLVRQHDALGLLYFDKADRMTI